MNYFFLREREFHRSTNDYLRNTLMKVLTGSNDYALIGFDSKYRLATYPGQYYTTISVVLPLDAKKSLSFSAREKGRSVVTSGICKIQKWEF